MMLGHQYGIPGSGSPGCFHPLVCVDAARIENAGVRSAVTPFTIQKSIGPKVNDDTNLHVLPCNLLRARRNTREILGMRNNGKHPGNEQRQNNWAQRPYSHRLLSLDEVFSSIAKNLLFMEMKRYQSCSFYREIMAFCIGAETATRFSGCAGAADGCTA